MPDKKTGGLLGRVLGRSSDPIPARVEPKAPTATRRFKAARPGRLAGGFGNIMNDSPRSQTRQDLRGLINHSREAAQNVDSLKSFEMMVRRHVVGDQGIALQMGIKNPDGKPDTRANGLIESAWKSWGERGKCTPCGRLSWWQIEKIAATMLAREGNFFLREWTGSAFGRFGYQVQPISIDLLDLDMVQTLGNGSYVDGGVEFNQFGRPTAFYFFDGHPLEAHTGKQRHRMRVPANQVTHVMRQTETGQALGVPESHTALRRFNMLAKYEEAAMIAAHYGASAMVFLEQDGEGAPAPDKAGEEELPQEIEAGTIVELPPGYTANQNPSNYPDANMPGFMKSMTRGGASGLGVSYAGLSGDMEGANFSSLKDGRGEERDEWKIFQKDLAEGLHGPIFEAWLSRALLSGRIALPAAKVDKFNAATWRGRGWQSVNPKDDAVADDKNLQNRLTTPSEIVARRGGNFADTVAKYAEDMATLKAANVPLSVALSGGETAPDQEPETPTDPDKG